MQARKICIGDVVLDRLHHQIHLGGEVRNVEPRLVRLLDELCAARGAPVSREDLLKAVSSLPYAGDEALTQAISKLRQLLGDSPKQPRFIKTIPRKGYALIADCLPVDEPTATIEPQVRSRGLVWGLTGALLAALVTWGYFHLFTASEIEIEFTEKGGQEFIEKKDLGTSP